jgi:trk system potassium uptake protein TrkA
MNIIVVGCGRVGSELAYGLFRRGHKVVVIDTNGDSFSNLPADFRGRTVEGDVLTPDVLERAGINHTDALAAVTPDDSVNAVVAHTARIVYHVPNIVVRDYDPRKRGLHETFSLQVVSPSAWGAQRIEELISDSALRTVFSSGNGEVEIYEFAVPSSWAGMRLQEVIPSAECRVVSLTRAGRAVIPTAEDRLSSGDVVLLSATREGVENLQKRLEQVKGA